MKRTEGISEETRDRIRRRSAYTLPTRPSDEGWSADKIKKALYAFVTDGEASVISEINRIVDEENGQWQEQETVNAEVKGELERVFGTENLGTESGTVVGDVNGLREKKRDKLNAEAHSGQDAAYVQSADGKETFAPIAVDCGTGGSIVRRDKMGRGNVATPEAEGAAGERIVNVEYLLSRLEKYTTLDKLGEALEEYASKERLAKELAKRVTCDEPETFGTMRHTGDAEISGSLTAKSATVGEQSVRGSATVEGDATVRGRLYVLGTAVTEEHETLSVKDSYVVTNSDGADISAVMSGIVIRTDEEGGAYAVLYDPVTRSVRLGMGRYDGDSHRFAFAEGEGLPVAVRPQADALTGGNLLAWDSTAHALADSGINETTLEGKVKANVASQLTTALDGMVEYSPNLVNPEDFEEGKYLSGKNVLENDDYYITGFFKINAERTYYYYHVSDNGVLIGNRRIVFYDSDKIYISMIDYKDITDTRAFTAPAGAAYARMSNTYYYKPMAVYEVPTEEYVPYYKRLGADVELSAHIDGTLSADGMAADARTVGDRLSKISSAVPMTEECWRYGGEGVKIDYHCMRGPETSTSASNTLCVTDFIPVSVGDRFTITYGRTVSTYDKNKSNIENTKVADIDGYSGNERNTEYTVSDENVAYIRVTMTYFYGFCAVSRIDGRAYEVLCLGDSIFGNNPKPYDISTYIQNITGLKTANCGFGGTTARTHHSEKYASLSFHSIADCIATGEFSSIDIDWGGLYKDYPYMRAVKLLKETDYGKLKLLTVAFGTNDWNLATSTDVLDNENDRLDVTAYKGALRYGIEKILSAYPKLLICLLSPLYRYWSDSSDYSTVDSDSDSRVNAQGLKLVDYVTAMREVAEEYKLPFFDNYSSMGINKLTAASIFRDGTHLNYYCGVERVGARIADEIRTII